MDNWVDVIPEHPVNVLQSVSAFKNGTIMMANYLENAHEILKIYSFDIPSKMLKDINLPGYGAVSSSSGNLQDYEWFFKFQTYTDPGTVYKLDLHNYQVKSLLTPQLQNLKLNLSDFVTDQAWYKSKDGTKVPMYMIRKKSILPSLDTIPKKPLPTILYGYGGFGSSETPSFDLMKLVFLNNLNGLYVVANIRGGGEFGKAWHLAAIQKNR